MESIMVALTIRQLADLEAFGGIAMHAARARLLVLGAGLALAGGIIGTGSAFAAAADKPVYENAGASVDARVEDLLARMTLEEKVAQMQSIWDAKREVFDGKLELDPKKMRQKFPDGIGQFARPSDPTGPASPRLVPGRDLRGTIRLPYALVDHALAHPPP